MTEEKQILSDHLKRHGLKQSPQRSAVLDIFLKTEKHMTAEELHSIVRKKHPHIGYTTVYRSLRLFAQCGLSRELRLDDGLIRFEHSYNHDHHDHLVCLKCGAFIEVIDERIEALQDKLAEKHGFTPVRHRMDIYGTCRKCSG